MSYPSDWGSVRRLVFFADDYECRHCGERGGRFGAADLECHHVVPKRMNGSDHPDNLVTLCRECHGELHRADDMECLRPPAGHVVSASSLATLPFPLGTLAASLADAVVSSLVILAVGVLFAASLGKTGPTVALATLARTLEVLFASPRGWIPWMLALVSVRYAHIVRQFVRRRSPVTEWSPPGGWRPWIWVAVGILSLGWMALLVAPYFAQETGNQVARAVYVIGAVGVGGVLTVVQLCDDQRGLSATAAWQRLTTLHVATTAAVVAVVATAETALSVVGVTLPAVVGASVAYRTVRGLELSES